MSAAKARAVLADQVRSILRDVPADRLQRALDAVLGAEAVDTPPDALAVPSGAPGAADFAAQLGGSGGRRGWIHIRGLGTPDYSDLAAQRMAERAILARDDERRVREIVARSQAAEASTGDWRFALLEIDPPKGGG